MSHRDVTYVFAGGGTGGHIYPALAIAAALDRDVSTRCIFLCSQRAIDERVMRSSDHEWHAIPAQPFGVRPRSLIRFLRGWAPSVRQVRRLLASVSGDVHMISTGGFVAAPAVQAARVERVPVTLVNLDAYPGKANRWIARHASRIVTTVDVGLPGWDVIQPIVRSQARASGDARACRESLGLNPEGRTLVVTGGSQGAASINRFMCAFAEKHADVLRDWQVLHQVGDKDPGVEAAYRSAGVARCVIEPFVREPGVWWGAATLALARAGAGTVGELWANRVPSLLMPYPFHTDGHQKANAQVLVDADGAVVETDAVDPTANLASCGRALASLMADDARIARMRTGLESLPIPDGAGQVAHLLTSSTGTSADPG